MHRIFSIYCTVGWKTIIMIRKIDTKVPQQSIMTIGIIKIHHKKYVGIWLACIKHGCMGNDSRQQSKYNQSVIGQQTIAMISIVLLSCILGRNIISFSHHKSTLFYKEEYISTYYLISAGSLGKLPLIPGSSLGNIEQVSLFVQRNDSSSTPLFQVVDSVSRIADGYFPVPIPEAVASASENVPRFARQALPLMPYR